MSEIVPSASETILRAYVEQHVKVRLDHWRMDDGSSALVHLHESGRLMEVLGEASGPLLQACHEAARFDKGFDRLPDETVDVVVGRVVREKSIGTLGIDGHGSPVFKPWK